MLGARGSHNGAAVIDISLNEDRAEQQVAPPRRRGPPYTASSPSSSHIKPFEMENVALSGGPDPRSPPSSRSPSGGASSSVPVSLPRALGSGSAPPPPPSPAPEAQRKLRPKKPSKTESIYENPSFCRYLALSTREVVLGSKLNVLMLLFPVAVVSNHSGWPESTTFLCSLLAIAPFAERLGYVTEQIAMHTNETLGGLLNATFGNATELIVSLIALSKGRTSLQGLPDQNPHLFRRLVQVSLLGSMLSNLLLVFGSAMLVGGLRFREQRFSKHGSGVTIVMLLVVCLALGAPVALAEDGPEGPDSGVLIYSRVVSVVLFILYLLYLLFQLGTHRHYYESHKGGLEEEELLPRSQRVMDRWSAQLPPPRTPPQQQQQQHQSLSPPTPSFSTTTPAAERQLGAAFESGSTAGSVDEELLAAQDEDEMVLGFWTAVAWLGIITGFVSVLSDYIVEAVDGSAAAWNVPEEFIGAVLLPIVANAAEHSSTVSFAYKDKMDIAIGVALGSAAQIGLSVLPICVLVGWGIGAPLDLQLPNFEAISLIVAVMVVNSVIRDGRSHWLCGVILLAAYTMLASGFWVRRAWPVASPCWAPTQPANPLARAFLLALASLARSPPPCWCPFIGLQVHVRKLVGFNATPSSRAGLSPAAPAPARPHAARATRCYSG
jgi:Ca2+/H+ antiporter